MYPFTKVLEEAGVEVEFFVVDARTMNSGRALVQLTVLLNKRTNPLRFMELFHKLNESMNQRDLQAICVDLSCSADLSRVISFSVLVLPFLGGAL